MPFSYQYTTCAKHIQRYFRENRNLKNKLKKMVKDNHKKVNAVIQ